MVATETASGLRYYHSDRGLYPFQAEDIARAYLRPANYAVWDCGTGKTHLAMALAALKFEDDAVDIVIVCCERNKIGASEWPADFARNTDLTTAVYHGTKNRRSKIREALPQVLISTYETLKLDFMKEVKIKKAGKTVTTKKAEPLLELLMGKRVLVIYDEIAAKLKNRTSGTYEAHEFAMKQLRRHGSVEVLNLSATPMDRGPENVFNAMRIMDPALAGTVEGFEHDYVKARDFFGNIAKYKNLDIDTHEDPGVETFQHKFGRVLLRRRKTDPELIEYFPKRVEEFTHVKLSELQADFYDTVTSTFIDQQGFDGGLFVAQRMIAADPRSLLLGEGKVSTKIREIVGVEGIRAVPSAKTEAILDYLNVVAKGQGAQVIVFSFFTSYLHWLQEDLQEREYKVAYHHGGQNDEDREKAKESFRGGDAQIFLTSDAGARGLNLPGALYSIQAELPLTYSNYIQRMDRNHRIDSTFPSVTNMSFVVLNTVEEGIEDLGYKRNVWQDKTLGDDDAGEGFISAEHRRMLTRISRANPLHNRRKAAA